MKRFIIILVLGALLLGACGAGDIEAREAWVRAAMEGGNSAAYFTLRNRSSSADALVGASSDAAAAVEIHLSRMDANGMMQMTRQESVPLAVGAEVSFQPGGLHVMLIGLTRDLTVGGKVQVVLHFEHHADITLEIPVQEMEGMNGGQHMP